MNTPRSQNQIIFIDAAVADPATLISGLAPGMEVVMLQPGSDGLSQIAAALAGRSNLQAIHLISHGSSGQIQLGSTSLDSDILERRSNELETIGQSLSESGDILLYGCNVAAGETGAQFIGTLARLTGADVTASDDLTGAGWLGGDWALEHASGGIESVPLRLPDFNAVLDTGTAMVKDISSGSLNSGPSNLTNINDTLFFSAYVGATYGTELWKSDGTEAGTVLVKDIFSGTSSSGPSNLTNINGTLFFTANDGTNGSELWKSDGTEAGTVLVKDIYGGTTGSSINYLTNVNGTFFFRANDGTTAHGSELWKSDGTAVGTVLVKDIYSGTTASNPSNLTNINGSLFFTANDGTNGTELWKSNGTEAGTVLVKDIYGGISNSSPNNLTNINGTLFFTANDGTNGTELWKSDGTEAGTVLVKDIFSGTSSSGPSKLTNINGTLFFTANDGTNGTELWKSDGTAVGTVLVKDIYGGTTGSSINYLTNVNDTLFFTANDGTNGTELWKSNGTEAGTVLVKDIYGGISNSSPNNLTNINDTLFFSAYVGATYGTELWKSDGTEAGTVLVKDIFSGTSSSGPSNLTNINGTLFFNASDGINGTELWATSFTPPPPAVTSATYDASTGVLSVTGSGLTSGGAVDETKLTLTGEGGATYTPTETGNITASSTTAFSITLNATDKAALNQIMNKAGSSSTGTTAYNLAGAADWHGTGNTDTTGNAVTVSNVPVPTITNATYDAASGTLVVTGTGFLSRAGASNDVDTTKLNIRGEGGSLYAPGSTTDVEITSGTSFTVVLSAADKEVLNAIINKNGTTATGGSGYTLTASDDFMRGADAALDIVGTEQTMTVSNVAVPTITSATYDASSGQLVVTGSGFSRLNGSDNDIVANTLTFTGQGGATYTLTNSANVDMTSTTAFTLTLSVADKAALQALLTHNGASATDATHYNLAAAEDWEAAADAALVIADLSGNSITVSGLNTAPTITDVPGTAQAVTAGTAAALANFTVADAEQGTTSLNVTLTASNGTINGVTDADNDTAGIQLNGTAADINTALAAATFTATASGAASIGISVSDSVVMTPTSASYSLTASAAPAPPAPDPAPIPIPTPTPDNDGVPDAQENTAPGLTPANGGVAVAGDGNGDGVADSQQSAVTSVSFLNTPTAQSNPASAPPVYVTLVAGAVDGKIDSTSTHSAALNNVHQLDAPAILPADITMPLGLIAFTANVQSAGAVETFSLYVDPTLAVNGYWKTNAAGTWVNLASDAYGGKTVLEGGKLRLDFNLTDGGEFDADGKADGVITDPGAAGFMPLSIVGYAPELAAGTHFWL